MMSSFQVHSSRFLYFMSALCYFDVQDDGVLNCVGYNLQTMQTAIVSSDEVNAK